MSRFQCFLCLKLTKDKLAISLTKKVDERLTLNNCIQRHLPNLTDTINNESKACPNCYTEFVSFYEFIAIVENNYGWKNHHPRIKVEKDENPFDNFIDITEITHFDPIFNDTAALDQPEMRKCSIILDRIDAKPGTTIKLDQVKTETPLEIPLNQTISEKDSDSDFEWPQNENDYNDWLVQTSPFAIEAEVKVTEDDKKPLKTNIKKENDADDKNYPQNRYLPKRYQTDEILSSGQKTVTVNGIEYRVPERRKVLKSGRISRPHRKFDAEGEATIAKYIDIKCHLGCDVKLENFSKVRKHFKQIHSPIKGFLYCFCGLERKFDRRYELLEHLDWHKRKTANQLLRCPHCLPHESKEYKTSVTLQSHINRVHKKSENQKELMCAECGKVFGSASGLYQHKKVHSLTKYECYICHKQVSSMFILKEHFKRIHTKERKPTQSTICPICSKMISEQHMKYHMKFVHGDERERVKCELCDHWVQKRCLNSHMKTHTDRSVQCQICLRTYTSKGTLKSHMNMVHVEERKQYECNECCKKFYREVKLIEHIAVAHTREFPWACRVCGRQFRAQAGWYKHEKSAHPEEYHTRLKPNYLRSNDEHERVENPTSAIHVLPTREDETSREGMVQCDTCFKSYASHERLRIHIKTVHSKAIQRNYECQFCGKRFYRSVKLKEHVAVAHTREFPWSCSICGIGFRNESSWYFHKKTAHLNIKFNFSEANEESVQNTTDISNIEIFEAQ